MMESVTIGELGATWIVLGGAVVAALTYIVTEGAGPQENHRQD